MTVQQCNYVLKIAACGSFNEAAKELFVAQSSLSVSVKALEQELGIRIFHRAGNGVYLTEEGTEVSTRPGTTTSSKRTRKATEKSGSSLRQPPRLKRLWSSWSWLIWRLTTMPTSTNCY